MARPKNDGRGRMGGRAPGTPNKSNPIKVLLHEHSLSYFTPDIAAEDVDIKYFLIPTEKDAIEKANERKADFVLRYKDRIFSQYDLDLMDMKPTDRAKAEIEILAYTTPKMQAISADMAVKNVNMSICEKLKRLASGEDVQPNET